MLREEGYFRAADGDESCVLVVDLPDGYSEDGELEVGAHDDLLGGEVEDDDGGLLLTVEGAVVAGRYQLLVVFEEFYEGYPLLVQLFELHQGILVL